MAPVNPPDTSPEIHDLLVARWRTATVGERIARLEQMHVDVERIAIAGIRRQHPGIDDSGLRYELFRRRYGDALAREVYPQLAG